MTCCFIGHRTVPASSELTQRLHGVLGNLIEKGVATFLFGDHSAFHEMCYAMVTEYKKAYPQIQRIHLRTNYPDADEYTKQFLMRGYEDSICPDGVAGAGKAAYIKRNQAMIRASNFCVFYYDEAYRPEPCRASANSRPPQSGTKLAFDYAKAQGKTIINTANVVAHFPR